MIRPVISPERALVLTVIAACIIFLSILIFLRRKKSTYPNAELSLVCLGTGLWLLDSIAVDRLVDPNFYLWAGRLTYLFPFFTLFWLVRFSLKFPPKSSSKNAKIVTVISLIIAVAGTFLALHPGGLVVALNPLNRQIINHPEYYYVTLAGFLTLLFTATLVLLFKWKRMPIIDKRAIRVFLIGVFVSGLLGLAGSLINSFRDDALFYQYAYPPIIVFAASLLYAFLRLGGFGISFSFSRRAVIVFAITFLALVLFTLL
jgi:hypothetical protein